MLSRLQTDYQRLEQSLQRLTDSIAAYNPSVNAAEEVVAADDAITQDLEILAKHQSNHARLETLRQKSASLDQTLKATFELLIQTRREIKAIPAYSEDKSIKSLQVSDILDYSKFIARTSVPRNRDGRSSAKDGAEEESKPVITNGNAGTPAADKKGTQTPADNDNTGLRLLDDQTKQMLDPFKDSRFEPWPQYAVLQQGALMDIQRMIDAGKDPADVLSAEEQAEADRLKAIEEEQERQEQEERDRRRQTLYHGGGRGAAQDDVFDPDEA